MSPPKPATPVVADSSPLITLAGIGKLHLLRDLYGPVAVPPAVWDEVTAQGDDRRGAAEVRNAAWIEVVPLRSPEAAEALLAYVDPGEAEAICLARELGARWFIVDDRRGQKRAAERGVKTVGTLGVIVTAKNEGLVEDAAALFDELERGGFYISDVHRRYALSLIR